MRTSCKWTLNTLIVYVDSVLGLSIGSLKNGLNTSNDWSFLIANKVTDADLKQAILLLVNGSKTFKLLRNLTTPHKPGDKLYADLVKVLTDHFSSKQSEMVQRLKFYSWSRKPGENVLCSRIPGISRLL